MIKVLSEVFEVDREMRVINGEKTYIRNCDKREEVIPGTVIRERRCFANFLLTNLGYTLKIQEHHTGLLHMIQMIKRI